MSHGNLCCSRCNARPITSSFNNSWVWVLMMKARSSIERRLSPSRTFPLIPLVPKDGNGSGSDRVESPCTQNRNPKSKPESAPKTDSGGNPSPKPNPRIPETRTDTRNPNGYPKPADIYTHIHMYKQEATNNKYFHESTLNKFNNLSKQIIISIL